MTLPKRPRDTNQLAKRILDIATGESPDAPPAKSVPGRAAGGKLGGKNRADALTPEKRKEIAQKAAKARWG